MAPNGKLNLDAGMPLTMACYNDIHKKECTGCMNCKSPECNRANCDSHGDCLCIKSECICLGRGS